MRKLHEIASIHSGIYAKPAPDGNTRYLQGKWFDEHGNLSDVIKPELTLNDKLEKHLLVPGDVLFAAKGTRNYATVYRPSWGRAIASSTFMIIKLKGQYARLISPEYLAWFLNHPATQQKLVGMAKGSFIQSIPKNNLKDIFVNFPNPETQHKILQVHELHLKKKGLMKYLEELTDRLIEQQLMNIAKHDNHE